MSRQPLTRPKTSAGQPIRRSDMSMASVMALETQNSDLCCPRTSTPPSSSALTHRLPPLGGAAAAPPRLSRRPRRLWTEASPTADGASRRVFIGEGAFGRVFRANFMGRPAAVKEVGTGRRRGRGDSSERRTYERELRGAEFLLELRHENIVRYLQFDTSELGKLYVVMEMVEGKNLTELRRQGPFSEAEIQSMIMQTCRGLHYLHSHQPPIVHRDVKGSNIMLTGCKEPGRHQLVKLVDLGLAIILCDEAGDATRRSLAGTHKFIAPEVYECQAYSAKSDVFALGCAAFELHCGRPPHSDKSNDMAICYAVMIQPMPALTACHPGLADLYASCTRKDPEMRPTAAEILQHRYLAQCAF